MWERVEEPIDWFYLPKRSGFIRIKEFFYSKPGYILEHSNGMKFMIPDQHLGDYNLEIWLGAELDDMYVVHCMNPQRSRLFESNEGNVLAECYTKGMPSFYNVKLVDLIDQSEGKTEISKDIRTVLLEPIQIINYCKTWIDALDMFHEDVFDSLSMSDNTEQYFESRNIDVDGAGLKKTKLISHFEDQIHLISEISNLSVKEILASQ